jgi:hypothetical protein
MPEALAAFFRGLQTSGPAKPGVAIACIALAAVIGAGYLAAPHFLDRHADRTLPISNCDPGARVCTANLPDGGALEFSVTPRPPRALAPLALDAALAGDEATLEVRFTGSEMEMGEIRTPLVASGKRFGGQATLPVCASGTMKWLATVVVTRQSKRMAVPFTLEVPGR